ncbi:hypothetical protein HIM_02035 [Hirsutella minnesotensis 3608]|nr:hypothetical protein HIM_02035 [Hirsutella minnesotensis 3608]
MPSRLPLELLLQIIIYVKDHNYGDDGCYVGHQGTSHRAWLATLPPSPKNKRDLSSLRLVNRIFCIAVTPHLFSHYDINSDFWELGSKESTVFKRMLSIHSDDVYAMNVRHVRIAFDIGPFDQGVSKVLDQFTRDLSVALPVFMSKLRRVETFAVRHMLGLSSWYDRFGNDFIHEHEMVPFIDRSTCMARSNSISTAVINSLLYVPLPHLRRLSLWLPATEDLGFLTGKPEKMAQQSMKNILSKLQALDIGMYENFGCEKVRLSEYQDDMLSLLGDTPVSGLQHLTITEMSPCVKLKNLLNRPFSHLRSIVLYGSHIPGGTLLRMISGNLETLHTVRLCSVDLTEGRWADVLNGLCTLHRLRFFSIYMSSYCRDSSCGHLRGDSNEQDFKWDLQTASQDDIDALDKLRRELNWNRFKSGLRRISKRYYDTLRSSSIDNLNNLDGFAESLEDPDIAELYETRPHHFYGHCGSWSEDREEIWRTPVAHDPFGGRNVFCRHYSGDDGYEAECPSCGVNSEVDE